MKGYEAVRLAIEEGKKIKRNKPLWGNSRIYFDGEYFRWSNVEPIIFNFASDDLSADDWEVFIEPYQEGDFVSYVQYARKNIGEVLEDNHELIVKWDDGFVNILEDVVNNNEFRRATPEEIEQELERRKWQSWRREINQWKVGDIFKTGEGNDIYRVVQVKSDKVEDDTFSEEYFGNMIMVCPVEMRVDNVE